MNNLKKREDELALASHCRGEAEDFYNMEMREGESLLEWRSRQIREIDQGMKSIMDNFKPF